MYPVELIKNVLVNLFDGFFGIHDLNRNDLFDQPRWQTDGIITGLVSDMDGNGVLAQSNGCRNR
jgi:hypothetical protein